MTDAVNNNPSTYPTTCDTAFANSFRASVQREQAYYDSMASALEGCVASLRSSMQNLDSTINILDDGVSDMPRLAKVLQTTRVR